MPTHNWRAQPSLGLDWRLYTVGPIKRAHAASSYLSIAGLVVGNVPVRWDAPSHDVVLR
jgi:hypothetical protein